MKLKSKNFYLVVGTQRQVF